MFWFHTKGAFEVGLRYNPHHPRKLKYALASLICRGTVSRTVTQTVVLSINILTSEGIRNKPLVFRMRFRTNLTSDVISNKTALVLYSGNPLYGPPSPLILRTISFVPMKYFVYKTDPLITDTSLYGQWRLFRVPSDKPWCIVYPALRTVLKKHH